MIRFSTFAFLVLLISEVFANASLLYAQTRDQKVIQDREKVSQDESWFYDDLASGIAEAEKTKKPLMVVLRCIP